MKGKRPCVLVAGPVEVCCKRLRLALEDLEVLHCETLDQAVERIKHRDPDLIVVCYLFDEMRPFRLIHYVRSDLQRSDFPIILVQVVDGHLRDTELRQLRDAYQSIGIDGFVNLSEEIALHGEKDALRRFRTSVISRLALAS